MKLWPINVPLNCKSFHIYRRYRRRPVVVGRGEIVRLFRRKSRSRRRRRRRCSSIRFMFLHLCAAWSLVTALRVALSLKAPSVAHYRLIICSNLLPLRGERERERGEFSAREGERRGKFNYYFGILFRFLAPSWNNFHRE